MKKVFTLLLLLSGIVSISSFSQSKIVNKWSAEAFTNFASGEEYPQIGIEYGLQGNYSLLDRLGFNMSLGSFHSLSGKRKGKITNASRMLLSINFWGDALKINKNRLRLSIGATYLNGDNIRGGVYIVDDNDIYTPISYIAKVYNEIGITWQIAYLYSITDKWYMGANIRGYENFEDLKSSPLMHIVSLGYTVGYNF